MDPTTLPSTLRARALTRQADWMPKSEVGLVECGLLNPGEPARPPVRAYWAPSAPLLPVRVSAPRGPRPPLHSTVRTLSAPICPTASSAPVRHVRSARARQPPLYIPHPASPQIIQLLAVCVGPRVSVAPLRTGALRGAQGLREVGVNCGENPCNFILRSKQHGEGDHLHLGRPGYNSS